MIAVVPYLRCISYSEGRKQRTTPSGNGFSLSLCTLHGAIFMK